MDTVQDMRKKNDRDHRMYNMLSFYCAIVESKNSEIAFVVVDDIHFADIAWNQMDNVDDVEI